MSLKITRPTVVVMTMPGVNSFSPSPLSFLCAGRRTLIMRVDADLLLAERQEHLVGRGEDARLDAVLVLVLAGLAGAAAPSGSSSP